MENTPTNRSLGHYILIWVGHNISSFGFLIAHFVTVWHITITTGGVTYIMLLNLANIIPILLVLLFASVFSDLLNRRILLIVLQILQASSTIILILFLRFGITGFGIIILFTCLRSIFQAFYLPTIFSIIPTMIPQEQLSRINGISYLISLIPQTIAPYYGSFLLNFFELHQILWVEVITIGLSIIPLAFIRVPFIRQKSVKKETKRRESLLSPYFNHFAGGFKALVTVPGFIILLGSFLMLNLLNQPFQQFFPFYILDTHSGTIFEYSMFLNIVFFGSLIGAVVVSIKKYWNPTILMFFISLWIIMIGNLIIALTPYRSFLLLTINMIIQKSFLIIPQTIFFTIMQTNIPKEKIGRVYGIYLTISYIITPLGGYLSGPFIEIFEVRPAFLVNSVIGVMIFPLIFFLSGIRSKKYEDFITQDEYFQIEKKE
ncbi:MAG: MFS transporter [Promethearchaeota archaeon]|jgi:DHA3 family macrolide efflux protein-like MFS transporter